VSARSSLLVVLFLAACGAAGAPTDAGPSATGSDAASDSPAADRPAGSGGMGAVDAPSSDGVAPSACPGGCPASQVCCSGALPCAGLCVLDCRTTDCYYGLVCDTGTGVCHTPSGTGGMGGGPTDGPRDSGSTSGTGGAPGGPLKCGFAVCSTGQLCCSSPRACAGMCVPDCRIGAASCPGGWTCSPSSGYCEMGGGMGGMGGMPMGGAPMGGMPMGGMPMGGMPMGGMGGMAMGGMGGSSGGGVTCGSTTCQQGSVCCQAPLGCANMCVPDCRTGGSCPGGLTCNSSTGVCSPAGSSGTGGMGGMGGMAMGGMGGSSTGGAGGSSGSVVGSCDPQTATGSGCTLTANTSTVSTNANGCALLARDTSGCAACRTGLGLSGFWLKFSCRVGISVVSSGGQSYVRLVTDDQPDYQTDYFASGNACYLSVGTKLNPNRLVAKTVTMDVATTPNTTATYIPGTIGMALNGVMLFSNIAAPGDDIYQEAQTFDRCQGHPTPTSTYHYHSEPYSISYNDSAFIGVLRDGVPLYGRRDMDGSLPTLDSHGGHTGTTPDSATPVYHYHVNLQVSTSGSSAGSSQWFLTTGTLRGSTASCSGCD
jgi:hypothetical protein